MVFLKKVNTMSIAIYRILAIQLKKTHKTLVKILRKKAKSMNDEKKICNDCEFLSITEEQQNFLKEQGCGILSHNCKKYKKQVRHFPYREPYIHPCEECLKN